MDSHAHAAIFGFVDNSHHLIDLLDRRHIHVRHRHVNAQKACAIDPRTWERFLGKRHENVDAITA